MKTLLGLLCAFGVVIAICGMAMFQTGLDNECTAAGGRVEFSTARWYGSACVRDGQVIDP